MNDIVGSAKTTVLVMAAALLTAVGAAVANDAAVCFDAGLKEQWAQAAPACTAAAKRGDAGAQRYLGFMYSNGRGVAQDDREAVRWYRLAAVPGLADGVENRDLLAKKMTREQLAQAEQM